jgi:mRNA interferase MazF
MALVVRRFEVWLVDPNPVIGSEVSKVRPCIIISPDEVNGLLATVTVAAMTPSIKPYPHRVGCTFRHKQGQIALDHIRSVSKLRLIKKPGGIDQSTCLELCNRLTEFFSFE